MAKKVASVIAVKALCTFSSFKSFTQVRDLEWAPGCKPISI